MAISPGPATWPTGQSLPYELTPARLEEPLSSGQFVSSSGATLFTQETLSTMLAQLIAKTKGLDPTDPGFRLYEYVEPDALDAMYDHARRREAVSWRFEFNVDDETVHVGSDGSIEVTRSD